MNAAQQVLYPRIPVATDLVLADLGAALRAGWRDFAAQPLFGLFFGAIYVAGGWLVGYALLSRGAAAWLIPVAAGFPLLAPFTAVGLYEVSRRREAGARPDWRGVLGAVRGRGDDQLLMMGGFVFVGFTFWMILAHGIFAIFLAESGLGGESLALLATPSGMAMLVVGGAVGAVMAFVFYAITLFSLPLLVERDVDFLTAIFVSLRAIQANRTVLALWAAVIAVLLGLAMLPAFAGLPVVLPVLAHATWHLYRRVAGLPQPNAIPTPRANP